MNGGGVAMYYNWLDRWDERRMRRRDDVKKVTGLVLDPELVFPANNGTANQDTFCDIAKLTALDSDRFFGLADPIADVSADDQWIRFPSSISTGIAENDTVHAKVTRAGSFDHAVIVFHHWNASSRNAPLARFFARQGLAVVEIAMPYHLERSRPGSLHADYMLSPNLGRTLQSVRQAHAGRQNCRQDQPEQDGAEDRARMARDSLRSSCLDLHRDRQRPTLSGRPLRGSGGLRSDLSGAGSTRV